MSLAEGLEPGTAPGPPRNPDPTRTPRRSFEVAYWKTIASLAEAPLPQQEQRRLRPRRRHPRALPYHNGDLDALGDYLLAVLPRTSPRPA